MTRPGRPPAGGRSDRPMRAAGGAEPRVAEVAAEISRLRHLLMRPGLLAHPRISAELEQLDRQVTAVLDQQRGRHRLPAAPAAVQDAAGYHLKPDPLTAHTGAELVTMLRKYREWAGRPPFRAMAERTRWDVAHSTMCVTLKSDALPALKVVIAIVAGCGGGDDDQQVFATAWRRISSGTAGVQGLRLVQPAAP